MFILSYWLCTGERYGYVKEGTESLRKDTQFFMKQVMLSDELHSIVAEIFLSIAWKNQNLIDKRRCNFTLTIMIQLQK